ncbi:hypothetical protein [Nonomuraea sp. SBT364]|uniref:hypothetical protein n=1 Tax=Nonomuraea sp. SBT364 TaxID=1580530 RepID=UPI00066C2DE9|nr:hypothetical protein [Nonomuraea sp. SBT364]
MISPVYTLRGQAVTVVCRFVLPSKRNPLPPAPPWLHWHRQPPGAPRNAAIRHPDGTITVRPFRGLRRIA